MNSVITPRQLIIGLMIGISVAMVFKLAHERESVWKIQYVNLLNHIDSVEQMNAMDQANSGSRTVSDRRFVRVGLEFSQP